MAKKTKNIYFSDELNLWIKSDKNKTFGDLTDLFQERAFALIILIVMSPSAMPIPTGGVTTILEIISALVCLQLIFGRRELWLPKKWQKMHVPKSIITKVLPLIIKILKKSEKISNLRLSNIVNKTYFKSLLGLLLLIFTAGSFFAPPFSGLDTLPAMGAVALCFVILLEDVIFLPIGLILGGSGILLELIFGAKIIDLFKKFF